MPLDTNTSLNASKLSTNAMTAIITPTVTPGSMLTLSRPSTGPVACSLFFLSFILVPLRPYWLRRIPTRRSGSGRTGR